MATRRVEDKNRLDFFRAAHVRFTPNSDRKSRHAQMVMSALPPKADMCSALGYVCFGPIADIGTA
jgi:hypothetical protein